MELKKPDALGALAAKATEKTQQEPDAAADALVGKTSYTCHPMTNYSLGRFTFEKGTLALDEDDAAEFDKLHASQPPHLRHNVRKVDVAAAEARLQEILAGQGKVQTGTTTTANNNPNGAGGVDPASTDAKNTQ
jgi:hypothetical protein